MQQAVVAEHIEQCLFDMADPQASHRRKRRVLAWLGYWATELERIRPGQECLAGTRKCCRGNAKRPPQIFFHDKHSF
jgi:hypothetical protein